MIDRLLKIHLEPVARDHRRGRMLRTLTRGWLAVAGTGLFLIGVHRSTGGISQWWFLLLFVATLIWSLVVRWRRQRAPLDFSTLARTLEAENPKLHARLLTAVEQKPDAATGELNFLQDRVIREALAEVAPAGGQAIAARPAWQRRRARAPHGRVAWVVPRRAATGGDSQPDGSRGHGDAR